MTTREELTEKLRGWFTGRLPQDLFEGAPEVTVDREEITVIGRVAEPAYAEGAREAEHKYGRKVSWGVRCGEETRLFTHLSVPVMTRLKQPERELLDTLVDAG